MPPRVVLIVAVVLGACAMWAKPYYNWDLLPYTAVALRFAGTGDAALHDETYAAAGERLPEPIYHMLAEGQGYRRTAAEDPESFRQQLPYYAAKPAFPLLLAAGAKLGVHPLRGAVQLPRLAYVALGAVLVVWAVAAFGGAIGPLVGLALAGLPFTIEVARLATPDGLSALCVLLSLVLLLEHRRPRAALIVSVLSVAVRPDNVIWVGIVAASVAMEDHRRLGHALVAAAVAIVGCIAVLRWAGVPGWGGWFYGAFVEPGRARPEGATGILTLTDYLGVLLRRARPGGLPAFLVVLAPTALWTMLIRRRRLEVVDAYTRTLALGWIGVAVFWLSFPRFEDRLLVPWYLLTVLSFLRTLRDVRGLALNAAAESG